MEQMRELLREVLKEELNPVVHRLDRLELKVDDLATGVSDVKSQVADVTSQVADVKSQLDRMEQTQTEDVVAMLQLMDKKITSRADRQEQQIFMLNNRLLVVEADLHRIAP